MEEKELFRIKKWHRGVACMLVVSLVLAAFTQFYETRTGERVRAAARAAGRTPETEAWAFPAEAPEENPLSRTARELMEYSRILEEEDGAGQSAGLEELEEKLEEYQQQVGRWNQETEAWLEEAGSEVLLARQKEFEEETEDRFAQLAEQLAQAGPEGASEAVVQTVQTLLNGESQEYMPVYGTQMPDGAEAGEAEAADAEEAAVCGEYSGHEGAAAPGTEAELDTGGLTALSEEMMQKAEELETPLEIYLYLKNHIHSELYHGSRKGAAATWEGKAGNDRDQASLLIAMLRYQGYPARYARGRICLNAEQVMNLTGTEDVRQAAEVLVKLGTPATLVTDRQGPVGIQMEHTWVEAYLPYGDYRGAGSHGGDAMWIPLDTFVKTYGDSDSVFRHLEEMGLTDEGMKQMAEACGTEYFDSFMAQWEAPFARLLEENPELTLSNRTILPEELSYLPMSLPYPVVGGKDTCAALPVNECDRITFVLDGTTLTTLTAAELYSRRLTVAYLPAGEEDRAVLEQYGSLFAAPAHLLRLRAALLLDGEAIAYGEPKAPGGLETFTMDVYSGIQKDRIENQLMAGGMYQVTADMQTMTEGELNAALAELEEASAELKASEERSIGDVYTDAGLGRLLDCAGKFYFARVDIADRILAEYMGINATRTLSVGMTGYTVTPVVMMGTVVGLEEGSLYIDVDLDSHGVVSLTGDKEAERRYMLTSGMLSSAYEGMIWEELLGVEAVSTAEVINQACTEGMEVYALCRRNYEGYRPELNVDGDVLAAVDGAIAAGRIVIIPAGTVRMGDWKGTGYMVTDPDTMATAYMISGGLNGGYSQETVELAFIGNALLNVIDIALACGNIVSIITLLTMGTPLGMIFGVAAAILTVVVIVAAMDALLVNFQEMDKYIREESDGEGLFDLLKFNAVLTVAAVALVAGTELAVVYAARQYLTAIVGSQIAQELLSSGRDPGEMTRTVRSLLEAGFSEEIIQELAGNLSADNLLRLGELVNDGFSKEQIELLLIHTEDISKYSEEVLELWKDYEGDGDTFLKLVDEFGEEFVEAFRVNGNEAVWEFEGLLGNAKYSEEEIQRILEELRGDGFANNPLRQAYESEVTGLKSYGEELLSSGMSEEDVARTLNQARRDLGIKYKDMTPQPLRDYIYEINLGRYGDELGPTYEWMVNEKGASNMDIIRSASTPNSDIDRLLLGFEEWLRRQ